MWAVWAMLLAQGDTAPPFKMPNAFVHLRADESLEADVLRSLSGPRVVLWLSTQGSILKDSTVESLQRFSEAYVEVPQAVDESLMSQLVTAPKAGVWWDAGPEDVPAFQRLGPRKRAVVLNEPVSEKQWEPFRAANFVWVEWKAYSPLTLLDWGHLLALPGKKVFWAEGVPQEQRMCDTETPSRLYFRVSAAYLRRHPSLQPPCGTSFRIVLEGVPDDSFLRRWVTRIPHVEWEIDVGADAGKVPTARAILARIEELTP